MGGNGACATRAPVHPPARGDDDGHLVGVGAARGSPPRPWGRFQTRTRNPLDDGSPPRPWGRCVVECLVVAVGRFTPTPVGTISWPTASTGRWSVHPHARGDDKTAARVQRALLGSPPRPWGRLSSPQLAGMAIRFTPTPVGTITSRAGSTAVGTVHPHARGDDGIRDCRHVYVVGSPPRPWGRCISRGLSSRSTRFTPTPVGTILDYTTLPAADDA